MPTCHSCSVCYYTSSILTTVCFFPQQSLAVASLPFPIPSLSILPILSHATQPSDLLKTRFSLRYNCHSVHGYRNTTHIQSYPPPSLSLLSSKSVCMSFLHTIGKVTKILALMSLLIQNSPLQYSIYSHSLLTLALLCSSPLGRFLN